MTTTITKTEMIKALFVARADQFKHTRREGEPDEISIEYLIQDGATLGIEKAELLSIVSELLDEQFLTKIQDEESYYLSFKMEEELKASGEFDRLDDIYVDML